MSLETVLYLYVLDVTVSLFQIENKNMSMCIIFDNKRNQNFHWHPNAPMLCIIIQALVNLKNKLILDRVISNILCNPNTCFYAWRGPYRNFVKELS